jgi:hypothetical protein
MAVHYLEIVSNDVDAVTELYQRMHGLSFGPPDPDLGSRGTFAIVIQGQVEHGLWQR